MKIKVISYSFTGNNDALAAEFAKEIGAEHLRITEHKKRTSGKIIKEKLFNKEPKINLSKDEITEDIFAIFFGPFWFGKIASPLRAYFKQLKNLSFKHGFASLCVGFDNPKAYQNLKDELSNLLGSDPDFVIIKKIADLFPSTQEPTQKMLTEYRINHEHAKVLAKSIKDEIGSLPSWKGTLL
jgi:DNA-directed RNA polymerase subunit F